MDTEQDRGTGRTSRQMTEAPRGAVFVWCNPALSYPRDLAAKIGRSDLRVLSPSFFLDDRWRGVARSNVVIDHAFNAAAQDVRDGYERFLAEAR